MTDAFVLPEDVLVTPVRALPPAVRAELGSEPDDYAITRPRSRTPSRVVDADTAELLRQFREAKPIVHAIIAFSRRNGSDPEETLVEAFPVLGRLVDDGLLVPADSSAGEAIRAGFTAGEAIDGFAVLSVVQVLEDTELYRAEAPGGRPVALKLARAATGLSRVFAREASVLRHLDGTGAASLIAHGQVDGRPYLAIEWLDGPDVVSAAEALRARGDEDAVFALATEVLDVYAGVHERGVLHGDVHPRNAIVVADGGVRLVDFGLSDLRGLPDDLRPRERGGVAFFLEPEFARARLADARPPRLRPAGEQYSVAALVFLIVAGGHYLRFSPEKHAMRRQIAGDAPLTFLDYGLVPSPSVEAVLRRALAKEPEERFGSIPELAAAFRAAVHTDRRRRGQRTRDSVVAAAAELTGKLLEAAAPERAATLPSPTASVTYGGAGLAYGLVRLARARADPELLALADLWSQRAVELARSETGFYSDDLGIDAESVGRSSPYHTRSGVHWVRGCVSHAMADVVGFDDACRSFVASSQELSSNPDLTLGRAGTLLAYASLVELGRALPLTEQASLEASGEAVAASLAAELEAFEPVARERAVGFLGIAHGWAGIIYALLTWAETVGRPASPALAGRLDELVGFAETSGEGLRWPRQPKERPRGGDFVPSWCNGSAGFVHLWLAAERVLDDDGYRALAVAAGRDAGSPTAGSADLCCGLAGRAYALLALFRATGEEEWLDRARRLTLRALHWRNPDARFDISLYKGSLGAAVLAAELPEPATAAMPLFERERWAALATPV